MNLEEFATQTNCPVCNITEQAEIEAAWDRGIRATTVMRWLVEVCGHDAIPITARQIRNHFESRHQRA